MDLDSIKQHEALMLEHFSGIRREAREAIESGNFQPFDGDEATARRTGAIAAFFERSLQAAIQKRNSVLQQTPDHYPISHLRDLVQSLEHTVDRKTGKCNLSHLHLDDDDMDRLRKAYTDFAVYPNPAGMDVQRAVMAKSDAVFAKRLAVGSGALAVLLAGGMHAMSPKNKPGDASLNTDPAAEGAMIADTAQPHQPLTGRQTAILRDTSSTMGIGAAVLGTISALGALVALVSSREEKKEVLDRANEEMERFIRSYGELMPTQVMRDAPRR